MCRNEFTKIKYVQESPFFNSTLILKIFTIVTDKLCNHYDWFKN